MSYEQAIELVGDPPAWVLQSILDRHPQSSKQARAAMVLLRRIKSK